MSRETLRGRLMAATPGPWQAGRPVSAQDDAALIAHARQDLPALLALADAAARDIDRCDACGTNPVAWGPDRGWCAVHEATGGALVALETLP